MEQGDPEEQRDPDNLEPLLGLDEDGRNIGRLRPSRPRDLGLTSNMQYVLESYICFLFILPMKSDRTAPASKNITILKLH